MKRTASLACTSVFMIRSAEVIDAQPVIRYLDSWLQLINSFCMLFFQHGCPSPSFGEPNMASQSPTLLGILDRLLLWSNLILAATFKTTTMSLSYSGDLHQY